MSSDLPSRPLIGGDTQQRLANLPPEVREQWERERAIWQAISNHPVGQAIHQKWIDALAANKKALEERLRAEGLPVPRTIEDWEDLALFIETDPDRIGSLTIGTITRRARIWAQRENWRLEKIATLMAQRVAGGSEAKEATQHPFIFCRDGNGWFIRGFGEEGHFTDIRPFQYLAKLLADPEGVVEITKLVAECESDDILLPVPKGDDVLDQEAIEDYKKELKELEDIDDAIEEASRNSDQGALERWEEKRQKILEQLNTARGLGGRLRKLGDDRSKLRSRVSMNLKRCREALRDAGLTELARHFKTAIRTQWPYCYYRPDNRPNWQFSKQ